MSNRQEWWNIRTLVRRKNILIFFIHDLNCGFCRDFLRAAAENYPDWRALRTEIAAVAPSSQEELISFALEEELPYPLLSDIEGRAREGFSFESLHGAAPPFVFAVDRFTTLYFQDLDETGDAHIQERNVFSEIGFLESQCPECGVYRWNPPNEK